MYGDIMIRDRKMYVVPTPYALAEGMEGWLSLIVPSEMMPPPHLVKVGDLIRHEADRVLVGYDFDLRTNEIQAHFIDNANAGRPHHFSVYRQPGSGASVRVTLRDQQRVVDEEASEAADDYARDA
jgi:hypothetical protein